MKFNFLVLYGLILLVSISSSEHLLNLVYSQSDNVSNPTNIDTEINNLLNKVGRGNIIDSTIDSLMQGMGSSPSSNSSSSNSSSSSSSLLNSLLPPGSSSSSSSPTSRPTTDSSGPNSSVSSSSLNSLLPPSSSSSSSSALNSLLPPSSSSSSSSPADTSSSMPNTSNVVNSEIMSIFKNQDSSQSSVTVNQVKNQNMKYFAKIVDKKSNNEDIISSNSLTEFNNELLKFCLESGLDSYSCSSIIQDSLQSAQFTSTYMGPATVNTDLIGYSLELKIK
ncbi:MAG TPA: hypothetical protein VE307_03525 [Nitrososphaeraceae archaeon]|nr:hypothetical protein [Nitrososphaeraceae archaeon]